MILRPDLSSAVMDPFCSLPQLILFCNIVDPVSGQFYNRDPRSTAVLAVEHLKSTGIGDSSFWGPEAEFFVFDDVRYEVSPNQTFYFIDSDEGPYRSEEHTSELQSLMRISYAVFCLQKKTKHTNRQQTVIRHN